MAVILEERGRGKFKPAPDYKVDEVKELLNKKIEEERQAFACLLYTSDAADEL